VCYDAVRKGLSGPYSHQHPVPPVDGQLTNIGGWPQMLSATSPLQQMHRNKHDADWTRAATMRRQDILRRVQAPVASEPVVIGHRGLKMNLAPDEHVRENTLQSFHSGISAGATFVEFDVQVSPLYIPDVFLDTLSQRHIPCTRGTARTPYASSCLPYPLPQPSVEGIPRPAYSSLLDVAVRASTRYSARTESTYHTAGCARETLGSKLRAPLKLGARRFNGRASVMLRHGPARALGCYPLPNPLPQRSSTLCSNLSPSLSRA
jgi:hypothetical protein